jgi:surfeit locus 1 family protein
VSVPHPSGAGKRPADRVGARLARVAAPAVALAVVVAILAVLGTWQVHRLAWKEALIARAAGRAAAPPVPLPTAATVAASPDDAFEYTRVTLAGTLDAAIEFHVFATLSTPRGAAGGPGWFVLSPLTLADGTVLFLNRGFVPDAAKDPASRAAGRLSGPLTATGMLRGRDAGNLFTPAADPARNRYFLRDPTLFAAGLGLDPAKVYPVTVDLDAAFAPPGGLPQPGETQLAFTNNHLGYALTWYGLMLTALGVGAVFLRGRWRGR